MWMHLSRVRSVLLFIYCIFCSVLAFSMTYDGWPWLVTCAQENTRARTVKEKEKKRNVLNVALRIVDATVLAWLGVPKKNVTKNKRLKNCGGCIDLTFNTNQACHQNALVCLRSTRHPHCQRNRCSQSKYSDTALDKPPRAMLILHCNHLTTKIRTNPSSMASA